MSMSDQITLKKEEADKTADFLWELLARKDNDCHPDWKEMEEIERLAEILEGRRPCPDCGFYPCCCADDQEVIDNVCCE
jgi:hypothetical protein